MAITMFTRTSTASAAPYVASGKLRMLAVASKKRSAMSTPERFAALIREDIAR
ncbi:MAG: hypothetical protein ABI547_00885 [Betaproteobacteria bacterium]